MPQEVVILSGVGDAEIPHGATPSSASPTGYYFGGYVPGKAMQTQIQEVGSKGAFNFPLIKMVWYWTGPDAEFPADELMTLHKGIQDTHRWIVLMDFHQAGSKYAAIYATPAAYAKDVGTYTGSVTAAIRNIRAAGETVAKAGSEAVKAAAQAAEEIAKGAGTWGKWLAIGGVTVIGIALLGPTLFRAMSSRKAA